MPANPHLERFTMTDEDGTSVDVVAVAHHTIEGVALVLVAPEDAFDDEHDDMDAWVRAVVTDELGARALGDVPDELVDSAWDAFDEALSLESGDAS